MECASRVYAWNRLDRMGALLVEGSDYFGEPGAPLAGMYAGMIGINAIGERGATRAVRERLLRLTQAWLAPGGRLVMPRAGGARIVLSTDPLRARLDSLPAVRVRAVLAH